MRLTYAFELILAAAVGMAIERSMSHPLQDFDSVAIYPKLVRYGVYFTEFCDPFCEGVTLVEGVALWVEFVRSRKHAVWGFGRCTWAITSFVAIMAYLEILAKSAASAFWNSDGSPFLRSVFDGWRTMFSYDPNHTLVDSRVPECLVGLLVISLATRLFHGS